MADPASSDAQHTPAPLPLDDAAANKSRRWRFGLIVVIVVVGVVAAYRLALEHVSPSHNHGDPAHPSSCARNLTAIGNAIHSYGNAHGGQLPDSFETLILHPSPESVTADAFVCASTKDTAAPVPTTQQFAINLGVLGRPEDFPLTSPHPPLHVSYIYAAKGRTMAADEKTVLVYEPPANNANRGMLALFGDGHVEFIPQKDAQKLIPELQAGQNPPRAEMMK